MRKPNKRLLHERSHLVFEFPQVDGVGARCYLPFLENCEVSESKKANLSEYSLLSRSDSLYAYTGAKSRVLNLRFNITLLHLLEMDSTEGINDRFKQQFSLFFNNKEAQKKLFTMIVNNIDAIPEKGKINSFEHAKIHREYYRNLVKLNEPTLDFFSTAIDGLITSLTGSNPTPNINSNNKLIDLMMFWINIVRSSVKNNSTNTTLGPPIVRLTHGPLYNNIPCVVESYNIRVVEEAGYELETLMPKRIEISMTLNENRTGNFGNFKTGKIVDGDNTVGWEAIFNDNNADPYNGLISKR